MTTVSVVVETVTARYESGTRPIADELEDTLAAVRRQTHAALETIVVVDGAADDPELIELRRRHPGVHITLVDRPNYFAEKNKGAETAAGEIVALLDGDCVPDPGWLGALVGRFEPNVGVVAGKTRYEGSSVSASTFSVPDFATVVGEDDGAASGFVINNVAFRRELLVSHPFEERIPRNGGCFLLFNELRSLGARIVYEPTAVVTHHLDVGGLGFVRKHFERGYDGMLVYRLDGRGVLRGTRLVRRFSALALIPITCNRIAQDWRRLVRARRQIGVSTGSLPYYAGVMVVTRLIELVGAMAAAVGSRRHTTSDVAGG